MSTPSSITPSKTPSSTLSILPRYTPPTPRSRIPTLLTTPISTKNTPYILLICCLITGLLDSTLFHAYGTFVSGMTGNTILFGLGAATAHTTTRPYRWAKSLIAILSFLLGCAAFSRVTIALGKRRRGTMMLSFLTQAGVVLLVGAFVQAEVVEGRLHKLTDEVDWRQAMPIAFLSFQSAGQIVASRALGVNEIPTVVLTSMLHDFAAERGVLSSWRGTRKRNQMVGAFVATVLGAVMGGFVAVGSGRMQSSLWVVGGLKVGIVAVWGVWPTEEGGEEV